MILQHPRPDTSPDAIARRKKANDQARAANIRQGYKRGRAADGDWLAPELGIVTLFDRGVEGIHIHMKNLANRSVFIPPVVDTMCKPVLGAHEYGVPSRFRCLK